MFSFLILAGLFRPFIFLNVNVFAATIYSSMPSNDLFISKNVQSMYHLFYLEGVPILRIYRK